MPKVSDTHKQERRNAIIEAARACFARAGFQGTTLQEIFAEAGLSAGAVYNYFRSKRDLVLAIAEQRHEEERVALSVGDADPVDGLKQIARHFLEAYLASPDDQKRRISLMTWAEALLDEAILKSVKEGVDTPRHALEKLIANGQQTNALRADLDPSALACVMVAMLQGCVLQKLWNPAFTPQEVSKICDIIIEGLRVRDAVSS